MTTNVNWAIGAISLLAFGTVSAGCGNMEGDEDTFVSALANAANVAYQHVTNFLVVNGGTNSNILMSSGTVPSQVAFPDTSLEIGFRRSDGHFVVDNFTGSAQHSPTDSMGVTQGGTSP